jgi:hypothetical protein
MTRSKKGNARDKGQGPKPKPQPSKKANPGPGEISFIPNTNPSPCPKQKCPESHDISHFWKRWTFWKGLIEFSAFCIGVYAVCVYKGQWDAAKKANDLNAANFRAGQRPWVGISPPVSYGNSPIMEPMEQGKPYIWHYLVKNFGNSPSLRTKQHTRSYGGTQKIDWQMVKNDIENLPLPPDNEWTIFPGQEAPNVGESNLPVGQDLLKLINSGDIYIAIGGRIQYFDEFGDSHETTWCMIYIPPSSGKPSSWGGCPIISITN